jgi:hypothetical protein
VWKRTTLPFLYCMTSHPRSTFQENVKNSNNTAYSCKLKIIVGGRVGGGGVGSTYFNVKMQAACSSTKHTLHYRMQCIQTVIGTADVATRWYPCADNGSSCSLRGARDVLQRQHTGSP